MVTKMSKETKTAMAIGVVVAISMIPWAVKISSQHREIKRLTKELGALQEAGSWNRQRLWDRSVSLDKMRHDLSSANEKISRLESGELEKTSFELVKEFHETYGQPIAKEPGLIGSSRSTLRADLIEEEFDEFRQAVSDRDIVEIADALGDLIYVVNGAAVEYGIDLDRVVQEIHRSNMSKLGEDGKPIYREDGKVIKGPNYSPPNLKPILGIDQ